MLDVIAQVKEECAQIDAKLQSVTHSDEIRILGQRRSELQPVIAKIFEYESVRKAMTDNAEIISTETDEEFRELAVSENAELAARLPQIEKDLEILLLPKDPNDFKNIIVEIRAGAGGDESSLFAASLLRMYTRFSEIRSWQMEVISESRSEVGGFKEVIIAIQAPHGVTPVYADLRYESGVHRVQRVPETEKQGRIHTSTATVAILPEAEEIDLEISSKDLRIDTFASSGPGGQSVNTTMSAVRITHLPTGTVVSCQDGKSQHKNKDQAMKVLRSRILQKMEDDRVNEVGSARRTQVGTGDRSEKIRTYNIPQDRITDHRIKKSWSNVDKVLSGDLEPIITALKEEDVKLMLEKNSDS